MHRIGILLCIVSLATACQRWVRQDAPEQARVEPQPSSPTAMPESEVQHAVPKPIAPHNWTAPLEDNLAYLQALLQTEDGWLDIGTGKKRGRDCMIYRHATEPLTVWIDEESGVTLLAETDTGFVCALKSMKKRNGMWFVKRVELRHNATLEKMELEFTQEKQPALTSVWREL